MRGRRHHFAAPLVLVIGCATPPPERRHKPKINPPPPALDAGMPVDAEPVAPDAQPIPPDASPAVAEVHPCDLPPQQSGVHCNPPSAVRAKIIAVEPEGSATVFQFAAGTDDGVERGWKGELLDEYGNRVVRSDFVVIKCRPQVCVAKVKLSIDVVRDAREVRLPWQ